MFLTFTVTHNLASEVKYFKNLLLDLLSICRYNMFLNIYISQGSVAT